MDFYGINRNMYEECKKCPYKDSDEECKKHALPIVYTTNPPIYDCQPIKENVNDNLITNTTNVKINLTKPSCNHQYSISFINGEYVTYCVKCGMIGYREKQCRYI